MQAFGFGPITFGVYRDLCKHYYLFEFGLILYLHDLS
jgi:hypothetical protein